MIDGGYLYSEIAAQVKEILNAMGIFPMRLPI